jgi:ABC-type spermidine/putrescine transport system permease subunit I
VGREEVTAAVGQSARAARPFRVRLRRLGPDVALVPFVAVMILLFVLPTLRMLSRSFLEPVPGLANYLLIFDNPLYRQVFATTFRVSLTVTLISIALAFPMAQFVLRCGPLLRSIIFAIVLVPFWTSLLVRVYGWTFLLQRTGVINGTLQALGITARPLKLMYNEGGVLIGITHYMLPFMIFSIYAALKAVDPRLAAAAATMGARPLRVFFKITLPLVMPGIIAGSLLVFIGSLGFFVTPALMGGPADMMLANLITFQAKEALNWPLAAAVASVLVCAVSLLAWIYFRFADRSPSEAAL